MKNELIMTVAALSLIACGGSSSSSSGNTDTDDEITSTDPVLGVASNSGSTYTLIADGATIEGTSQNSSYPVFFNQVTVDGKTGRLAGSVGTNSGYLGLAAINSDDAFYGNNGTATIAHPTTSGTVTFAGQGSLITSGSTTIGAVAVSANMDAGTIVGTGPDGLIIAGTISGSEVAGTTTYNGESGVLSSGFYDGGDGNATEYNGVSVGDDGGYAATFSTIEIDDDE